MPCYDKKLEASRDDFVYQVESEAKTIDDGLSVTEVDSVLTSGEVLELINVSWQSCLVFFMPSSGQVNYV